MSKATPYPSLFTPFTLAGRPLRNRIVHASMNTHMAQNTRVTDQLIQYHANNPRVALPDEVDWRPAPAKLRRRVVVAGMEAAWIAAARGHQVSVFGCSSAIGGNTRLHAQLPGGEPLSRIYEYQYAAAIKAGARFELGVAASVQSVLALKPDAVILATGSHMPPPWLPAEAREGGWFATCAARWRRCCHAQRGNPAPL